MATVQNVHRREVACAPGDIDRRFSALGTAEDDLWPREQWFGMHLDASPDNHGAGGHGPVRYHCCRREPGEAVFCFDSVLGSTNWQGTHRFSVQPSAAGALVEHRIDLSLPLKEWLSWRFVVEPLHDALIENLLDKADGRPPATKWTWWVRLLRRLAPATRGDHS
jgi:hypothetical protein